MRVESSVVGGLWIAFLLYWLILAQFNKQASKDTPWRAAWAVRLVVIVGVLLAVSFRRHDSAGLVDSLSRYLALNPGTTLRWLGVVLCLAGFGLAIWARGHLGRNWGMPMSLRQEHELVTSGPYAYIRHPIYTGLLLALIGSALAVALLWLLIFIIVLGYFLISARAEEKMMLAQFPDTYPAYRRRTKMLIPLVF